MKGILLAGGTGTRLFPITLAVNKHLLPVYDKPLIYYPLSLLMLANIRDILIISTSKEVDRFKDLFGNGKRLGLNINYEVQEKPRGLADAFILGRNFINNDDVMLVLGDNILIGPELTKLFEQAIKQNEGATVFAYPVNDVTKLGAVKFNENNQPIEIAEKPSNKEFKHAVIGVYIYRNDVIKKATTIKPSARGELEITDINKMYLQEKRLNVKILSRAHIWVDAGTLDTLWEASNMIRALEKIQSLKIGAVEEIAYRKKWITEKELFEYASAIKNSEYGQYLLNLIK